METKIFGPSSAKRTTRLVMGAIGSVIAGGVIGYVIVRALITFEIISIYQTEIPTVLASIVGIAIVGFFVLNLKIYNLHVEEDGLRIMKKDNEFAYYPYNQYSFGSYVVSHRTNGIPSGKDVYLRVFAHGSNQVYKQIKLRDFKPELLGEALTAIQLTVDKEIKNYEIPEATFLLQSHVKDSKVYLNIDVNKSGVLFGDESYSWGEIDEIKMTPPNYSQSGSYSSQRVIEVLVNGSYKTFKAGPTSGKHAADPEYSYVWSILNATMLKLRGKSVNKL